MSKKKRNKAKRRYVNKNERVAATAETLKKLPVDPFPEWAKLGEANGGLEPQQVTALLDLADAFNSVTEKLGYKPMVFQWQAPGAPRDMSPAETKAWETWFAWAIAFERQANPEDEDRRDKRINGFHVAQFVVKRDRKTNAGAQAHPRLALAANLWQRVTDDYAKGVDIRHEGYQPGVDRPKQEPDRVRIRTWAQATA